MKLIRIFSRGGTPQFGRLVGVIDTFYKLLIIIIGRLSQAQERFWCVIQWVVCQDYVPIVCILLRLCRHSVIKANYTLACYLLELLERVG